MKKEKQKVGEINLILPRNPRAKSLAAAAEAPLTFAQPKGVVPTRCCAASFTPDYGRKSRWWISGLSQQQLETFSVFVFQISNA